jgi:hypothetical protein
MAIYIKFVLFERTFKMIYKLPLQLFRILLGFRNKSTYFDQKQRAFRHLGYAFDMPTSQVGYKAKFLSCKPHVIINMKLDFPKSF